jgi:predicted dehydrogenase
LTFGIQKKAFSGYLYPERYVRSQTAFLMNSINRRNFLSKAGSLAAASGFMGVPTAMAAGNAPLPPVPANDRIGLGLIGCRGVGWQNLQAHLQVPGIEFIAFCDVDQSILDQRKSDYESLTGKKIAEYRDFRKMLENKDIDAVIISTPDHWHALITIAACEAGKDVYVEKPLGNNIEECEAMVRAVRHFKRVCQVGQQQRSGLHWQGAIRYVHSGALGPVRYVKTWGYINWKGALPPLPDEPVPAGVDYDMWLGPAPERPFNPNRFHYNFRYFWDYAGGMMTDWGVHMIDIAFLGMKASGLKSVMSSGGKIAYPKGVQDTPDTQQVIYEFKDHMMSWEHAIGIAGGPYNREHGVAFIGDNGTLIVDRNGWEVLPEMERSGGGQMQPKMEAVPLQAPEGDDRVLHSRNFIECIRSRKDPVCSIESGAEVARIAHYGNIAFRSGQRLNADPVSGELILSGEARQLAGAHYRTPWKLSKY